MFEGGLVVESRLPRSLYLSNKLRIYILPHELAVVLGVGIVDAVELVVLLHMEEMSIDIILKLRLMSTLHATSLRNSVKRSGSEYAKYCIGFE